MDAAAGSHILGEIEELSLEEVSRPFSLVPISLILNRPCAAFHSARAPDWPGYQ